MFQLENSLINEFFNRKEEICFERILASLKANEEELIIIKLSKLCSPVLTVRSDGLEEVKNLLFVTIQSMRVFWYNSQNKLRQESFSTPKHLYFICKS